MKFRYYFWTIVWCNMVFNNFVNNFNTFWNKQSTKIVENKIKPIKFGHLIYVVKSNWIQNYIIFPWFVKFIILICKNVITFDNINGTIWQQSLSRKCQSLTHINDTSLHIVIKIMSLYVLIIFGNIQEFFIIIEMDKHTILIWDSELKNITTMSLTIFFKSWSDKGLTPINLVLCCIKKNKKKQTLKTCWLSTSKACSDRFNLCIVYTFSLIIYFNILLRNLLKVV